MLTQSFALTLSRLLNCASKLRKPHLDRDNSPTSLILQPQQLKVTHHNAPEFAIPILQPLPEISSLEMRCHVVLFPEAIWVHHPQIPQSSEELRAVSWSFTFVEC